MLYNVSLYEWKLTNVRVRGATLKVGDWLVTQIGGGGWKHFFSVTLYNFQKSGKAEAPPASPPSGPWMYTNINNYQFQNILKTFEYEILKLYLIRFSLNILPKKGMYFY